MTNMSGSGIKSSINILVLLEYLVGSDHNWGEFIASQIQN